MAQKSVLRHASRSLEQFLSSAADLFTLTNSLELFSFSDKKIHEFIVEKGASQYYDNNDSFGLNSSKNLRLRTERYIFYIWNVLNRHQERL